MPQRKTYGGRYPMRPITTSLRETDIERIKLVAKKLGTTMARWMRETLLTALAAEDQGDGPCKRCGHFESEHNPDGCTLCRCYKFRRDEP